MHFEMSGIELPGKVTSVFLLIRFKKKRQRNDQPVSARYLENVAMLDHSEITRGEIVLDLGL